MKLLWNISVGFDVTDELLIKSFAFIKYWRKKLEYNETVHHLFVDFKKACDSIRRKGRFSPSTSVSPANLHSIKFSIIITSD
jgi:hypothetical protein